MLNRVEFLWRQLARAREIEGEKLAGLDAEKRKKGRVPRVYYRTATWTFLRQLSRLIAPTMGCKNCRRTRGKDGSILHLECHHLYSMNAYRRLGFESPKRDLAMLCNDCHNSITQDHRRTMAARDDPRNRRARRAALQGGAW